HKRPPLTEKTNGASPQRDVLVNQDVRGAFDREFGRRNGVHVCAPTETVGEKGPVCPPPWQILCARFSLSALSSSLCYLLLNVYVDLPAAFQYLGNQGGMFF
ncbi:unnamed protein product, partial [Laminaria digitata]